MILPAVAYTLIAASANVVGAAAVTSHSRLSISALDKLIAFSAGFLISVALADLVPEAIAQHGATGGVIILAGYLLVHLTQHTLAPHFHFGEEVHHVTSAVSVAALIGLLLHTFIDGVAIASGFSAQISGGIGDLEHVPGFGCIAWTCARCWCSSRGRDRTRGSDDSILCSSSHVRSTSGGWCCALRRRIQPRSGISG